MCIVGDGAEAIALAGLVSANGTAQDAKISIRLLGGITPPHIELATGLDAAVSLPEHVSVPGSYRRSASPINVARYFPENEIHYSLKSRDVEECLRGADAVIISGPATAYSAIARALAPGLNYGTTVALVGAPLLGAWQFGMELKTFAPELEVTTNIVELDWLFNHAHSSPDGVAVLGMRRRVNLSGRSRNEIRRALPLACILSPGLLPASNMFERGFLDAESVVRPVFALSALLGGRMEGLGDLSTLLNRSNLAMLAELEQEISRLSFSYKCALADFARALREESYCQVNFDPGAISGDELDQQCYEATLAEALIGISGEWFKGLNWSQRMAQEVLSRYVSDHLVLMSDLAHLANVPTPVLDGVISISSSLVGFDLRNKARSLTHLRLKQYSQNELLELVNG